MTLYYKHIKGVSPFLRLKIPIGTDYEDDEMSLKQSEGTLIFELFGGKRRAEAQVDIGFIKADGRRIIAQAELFYTYNQNENAICVCENEFIPVHNAKRSDWQRPAVLRLFAEAPSSNADKLPFLEISTREKAPVLNKSHNINSDEFNSELCEKLRRQLCQIHGALLTAASEQGLSVTTCLNPPDSQFFQNGMVGGRAKAAPNTYTSTRRGTVFYNIVGSADDPKPFSGGGWKGYYQLKTSTAGVHCSSWDANTTTSCTSETDIIGGHIIFARGTATAVPRGYRANYPLDKYNQRLSDGSDYFMLLICSHHNVHWDSVMQTWQVEKVLNLESYMQ